MEKYIIERMRRTTVMKQIWSKEREKIFVEDYERRVKMFIALVRSVTLYGTEIWGWENEERMKKIKRKYIKYNNGY